MAEDIYYKSNSSCLPGSYFFFPEHLLDAFTDFLGCGVGFALPPGGDFDGSFVYGDFDE